MNQTKLLTTSQAAEFLGFSTAALASWRVSGEGPRYIKTGRVVRYRLQDINEWVEERVRESTSKKSA